MENCHEFLNAIVHTSDQCPEPRFKKSFINREMSGGPT